MVLLVIFDLTEEDDRDEITARIKSYESSTRLSDSAYLIETTISSSTVLNDLGEKIVDLYVEQLFVVTLPSYCVEYFAAHGKVAGWLERHVLC